MSVMKKDGFEIFNGFDIEYPEYEVITPQTLRSFTVRTLTVSGEERMKASLLTPSKLPEHLNNVIWESLVKKPEDLDSFETFLANTTIKDRDALMYGLYHISFGDLHGYEIECPKCEHQNSVNVNFLDSLRMDLYPFETPKGSQPEILGKELPIKLKIAAKVSAIVHQPTLVDEKRLMEEIAFKTDEERELATQLLIIKRFEIEKEGSDAVDTIDDRNNIKKGYLQLPPTDRRLIDEAYLENFGKYGAQLMTGIRCQKCGYQQQEIQIDLVQQFFRSIYR